MPNHITNILKIDGNKSEIKKCLESISSVVTDENGKSFKTHIDFNKIVPRPDSLNITSGGRVDDAIAIIKNDDSHFQKMMDYHWAKELKLDSVEKVKEHIKNLLTKEEMEEGEKAIFNMREYGHKDWYDWSVEKWGTKWNAYDSTEVEFGVVQFDTAWATPFPVMKKLAQTYPNLQFVVEFADEDIGNNCGLYKFENGVLVGEYIPKELEAVKFACEVKGIDYDEMMMDNFEYWSAEEVRENENEIISLIEKGYEIDILERTNDEDKEKVQALIDIAVQVENYELAEQLRLRL